MSTHSCPSCNSDNQREFTGELNIHFPGVRGLDVPTVWAFPRLMVCMDCGSTQFTIPKAELKTLEDRDYRYGSSVLLFAMPEGGQADDAVIAKAVEE